MTPRTFNELFEPQLALSLVRTPSGWCSVLDQHGSLYFPPTQDMAVCLRFMQAMAQKKHAVIDDQSVERATWHSTSGGVPEREQPRSPVTLSAPHGETATPPETFSRAVLADVIPINRRNA